MNGPLQPPGAPQTLPVDVTNELLRRSRRSTSLAPSFDGGSPSLRRARRRWRSRPCGGPSWRQSPRKPGRGTIRSSRAIAVTLGFLAIHCLRWIPHVLSEYDYCLGKANQADTDGGEAEGDGVLDPEEFATMVYNVTNGTLDFFTAPGAVPDAVTASYSTRVPQGEGGLVLSNASIALEFCTGLYESLLSFYGLAFNGVSCLSSVEFGQGNNPRITSDEYARFVYKLSGGKFGSQDKGMLPDELPAPLSDVFYVYGGFDFENATNEYYQGVCSETSVAILVSASYDPPRPPTPPPSGAPGTLAPTGVPVPAMPDDFRLSCQTALIVGDSIERDDRITEDEYVRFVSRLVPDGAVSVTASFASIPLVLQTNFQTLATNQTYIDVTGSKPNSSPTAEQAANLDYICEVTYSSILAYEDGSAQATSSPSPSPNTTDTNATATTDDDLAFDWILTDEAYAACKLSMMYSDLNRDNILDLYEYLRFINRGINSTTTTFASPADLPALFQSDFDSFSDGGNGVDVAGSKPAPSPTDAQDKHLRSVCRVTGKSISAYLGDGGSNSNGTSSSNDEFLKECIDAISVADRDSNGVMDQSEYLRFVNKLMGSTFTDFDNLADPLRSNYETLSQGETDGVSIGGVSDGTLTTSEREQITFVCSETQNALNTSKSEIENLNDLSEEDFQQCMKVLGVSDVNNNGWLEPIEYVDVVNLMTNQEFKGAAFSDLDKLFRVSYEKSLGSNPFVDVAGAKEGIEATDDQLKNLKEVCVGLLDTVRVFEKPTDKQLGTCISLLQPRFLDDESLSPDDYLWLTHKLAPDTWQNATSVQDLPFVVGDNYEWVKYGGNSIDLSKVGDGSALNVSEQLNWTCTRTLIAIGLALDVVAESRGDPLDFCTIPISFSDVNADNNLDRQEFRSLIDHFSGNAWAEDEYSSLDQSIQKLFNDYVDVTTETIPIHGSKPGANASEAEREHLKAFCGQVEGAVQAARSNALFQESCVNVLRFVDVNDDSKLSPEEYTAFLFELAGLNALDQSFEDLDPELQSNYDRFKRESNSDQVNLNSTSAVDAMCVTTKDSLGKVQEASAAPDSSKGSSSIGLWAMAGIAAGIATFVFGSGAAIYCCWAKRRDRESSKDLHMAQPECSPYSDYDPEAQVGLKPSSRSSGDGRTEDFSEASATEQFEDEPGNAVTTPKNVAIDTMEDATSEHFEDEHVPCVVEAHKAPVYADSDYGYLQDDAVEFEAASFDAPNGDMDWNPDSDTEEFQAFAAASETASHSDPIVTSDVTPVNPFEQVSPEIGGESCDLPPVNPFGEVTKADNELLPPQSPQRPQNRDSASSPRPNVESPVRSPSRDSVNYSAKSSPRRAPPSSPQRTTPSNSKHLVSPSGGSVSTRERRNHHNSTNSDGSTEALSPGSREPPEPKRLGDTTSQRLDNESSWTDEVILVSPLAEKPSVNMEQGGESGEAAIHVDRCDDDTSESESESHPEDEDASESDEDESESEHDDDDDASSEADTIDDSLRPNRSSADAQKQPHYKEIKGLVAKLMPDELPNVDVMISQFAGNEEELLQTLQNMDASSPRAADVDESGNSESESSEDDEGDESDEEESDDDDEEDPTEGDGEEQDGGTDNDEDGDDEDSAEDDDEASSDAEPSDGGGDEKSDVEETEGASECHDDGSASASSESESDASEESRKGAEAATEVAESVYDEESYYSEEVVESDEETIDDEEETIQSEGEDGGSDEDGSSSYESDSD